MEIEIISKECIKPSSPTPPHLRTHKLSILDQFAPPNHIPVVLYYPITTAPLCQIDIEKRLHVLKQSLSQTLSRFYPFAGEIKDNLCIDCNDEGAYFVEARVKANLSEFLTQPNLSLLRHFLPSWKKPAVAMVQVSMFDCGGITIGVYISHKVGDGISISTFLKDWGATARDGAAVTPDFTTLPTRFSQNDSFSKDSSMMAFFYPLMKTGKAVTRRFVFDASALAKLKAKSTSSMVQNPTRVEVVSALIWKCTMAAFKSKSGIQNPFLLTHAVNLRRREVPPLSEYLMGNLVGYAFAQCTPKTDTDTELGNLVIGLRESISKINVQYLKNLETDHGFYNFCESFKEMCTSFSNKGAEHFLFSSWCHFGFYEVDFGWGKPVWASSVGIREEETSVFMNYVVLMENKWGDGIEAWVTLKEQDMAILECDEQLLAFVSLNPTTLQENQFIGA